MLYIYYKQRQNFSSHSLVERGGVSCTVLSVLKTYTDTKKKNKKQKITYPLKGQGLTSRKYMYVHVLNLNRMPPYNLSHAVLANRNFWL